MQNLKIPLFLFLSLFCGFNCACQTNISSFVQSKNLVAPTEKTALAEIQSNEIRKLLESADEQLKITRGYEPNYVVIKYPMGDVPIETGVCSDVVIRAFRKAGVDLQKEIHEDMQKNFAAYPQTKAHTQGLGDLHTGDEGDVKRCFGELIEGRREAQLEQRTGNGVAVRVE